jgi:hypothetical protein
VLKDMLRYRKIDTPLTAADVEPGRMNIASEKGIMLPAIALHRRTQPARCVCG